MLLIDGISPSTPAPLLFSFIDPIVSQVVPVGCMVRTEDGTGKSLEENRELCELLARFRRDYRGLVEVILAVPDLADPRGFFAMRRAGDAQTTMRHALAPFQGSGEHPSALLSVATEVASVVPPMIEGLRSAGFRSSILLPSESVSSVVWKTGDGNQQIFGGRRIPVGLSKEEITRAAIDELAQQDIAVLVASLSEDASQGHDGFFRAGATLGDAVALAAASGGSFATLPSELRHRSGEAPERHLVLVVDATEPNDAVEGFLSLLRAAGLPFSEIRNAPENGMDPAVGASDDADDADDAEAASTSVCWAVTETDPEGSGNARAISLALRHTAHPSGAALPMACAALGQGNDPAPVTLADGLDVVLHLSPGSADQVGLDDDGVLRIAVGAVLEGKPPLRRPEFLRDELARRIALSEDAVLLIGSNAIAAPVEREALATALSELAAAPNMKLTSLDQHARKVTAADEPLRLTKIARRFPARVAPAKPDAAEREMLLEDARLAWSFFDRLSDPRTGLAAATAWTEGKSIETYNFATMWDTGTQILATISAHSIGLIDQDDFRARIGKILGHIADGSFGNLRLPKGVTSTTGRDAGIDAYNASDTARLLIALRILDGYAEGGFAVKSIVSRWDLDKTFRNGVPQTVQGSRMASAFGSNYANYISRAFGLWGFETASPYAATLRGPGLDADIEILHEVADLGPIGTEPHLLEAVELGFSPIAKASAEALFAAQIEEYRATGRLVCVSEVPIDREPWFIYQGYQIGSLQERWTFETLTASPLYKTRGFRRAVDQVSSKAAFLWHVTRPGEYPDLLLEHVRKNAKGFSLGFAPGVFSASGRAEQNYADTNTNGVILQAIAYKLNGGKPAVEWRQAYQAGK